MTRSNCIAWALGQWWRTGGIIRVRRSPDYPLLPRVAWSRDGKTWYRFMHVSRTKATGMRKWVPVHAIWFHGKVLRDIT